MLISTATRGTAAPAGLAAFVAACTAADGHAPFEEHTLLSLDGARQLPHARSEVRDADRLVACAVLSEGITGWSVELAVLPSHRGAGLGGRVLREVLDHVAGHGGGRVRTWIHGPAGAARALAQRHGARTVRRLLVLSRDLLDLPVVECPDGVAVRPLAVGEQADREAWLELSNVAFEGHEDNGGWTHDDLAWRLRSAWTDGRRFPVAVGEDGLLAGVWTKVEPGARTGELHVVAVHPRAQGSGLGRLVVGRALHDLSAAGCTDAELYVDAGNARARRLYDWAGFAPGVEHHCVELVLAPS